MQFSRSAGVLMHIASLPGPYGIGVLGQSARDFVDFLREGSQTLWQILPIGPTGYGNSPYQSYSSFAGSPLFIDPEQLCRMGYITQEELAAAVYDGDQTRVDYTWLEKNRRRLFHQALPRFRSNPPGDFRSFCEEEKDWLEDYALFMALKDAHGGLSYTLWEEELRTRRPEALAMWRVKCAEGVAYYQMLQYLFYTQWRALKAYANRHGVQIVGDIPIYVAPDSADVWTHPQLFMLDREGHPLEVAGCPPDMFSEDGQLWGNPVYNWKALRRTGYRFWIDRLQACLKLYDILRIDHFRAFADYYCIPAGAKTARIGQWRLGPGMSFFRAVRRKLGDMPLIAEDLGGLSPVVRKLLADTGLPGMKVLQFAFDPAADSDHLPHHHVQNGVVYTGTHDNDTILGWEAAFPEEAAFAREYMRLAPGEDLVKPLMQTALASVADLCVLTMQDLIGLGSEARMNTPSTIGNNWHWRATADQLTPDIARWLDKNTRLYRRIPPKEETT